MERSFVRALKSSAEPRQVHTAGSTNLACLLLRVEASGNQEDVVVLGQAGCRKRQMDQEIAVAREASRRQSLSFTKSTRSPYPPLPFPPDRDGSFWPDWNDGGSGFGLNPQALRSLIVRKRADQGTPDPVSSVFHIVNQKDRVLTLHLHGCLFRSYRISTATPRNEPKKDQRQYEPPPFVENGPAGLSGLIPSLGVTEERSDYQGKSP